MVSRQITLSYSVETMSALDAELGDLCRAAIDATKLSYSPYSRFRVGCAARLRDSRSVVCAANLENAAYPQCICAEAALLAQLNALHPGAAVEAIAIAVEGEGARPEGAGPCGSCRQQLFEAEMRQGRQPIRLLLVGSDNTVRIIESCSDLLPLGFSFAAG